MGHHFILIMGLLIWRTICTAILNPQLANNYQSRLMIKLFTLASAKMKCARWKRQPNRIKAPASCRGTAGSPNNSLYHFMAVLSAKENRSSTALRDVSNKTGSKSISLSAQARCLKLETLSCWVMCKGSRPQPPSLKRPMTKAA